MKKVLFILPCLAVGGLERVQVTLANTLAERGHNVTVMIYGNDDELACELDKRINFVKKPSKPHPIMSRIPYIRHKYYDDGMWETRASAEKLHNYYVGNEKYDVEIAFFRGLSIKIISGFTDSDTVHLAWVHTDFRNAIGYKYHFKNLEAVQKAYKKFDKVVCVSKQAEYGFKEVIGDTENTTTIYNPLSARHIVEKATIKPDVEIPKHSFNIVMVGRVLDCTKGQKRLIDAVSSLRSNLDIGLTLVGGGVDEEMIRDYINEKNANAYVYMTGNQANPYPYIAQSDLLVCASYYEGYNLTVAEALILGVPVLSTRCTGPVEILDNGKYGMIVDNSTDGLIDGISKLATDKELYAHYKAISKKRCDFFDEEKILNKIEELFEGEKI